MCEIPRITIAEFEGLFKGELKNGCTAKAEDYDKIISKFSGGGITSKEELALFLAFILWENSYPDGGHPELDCLSGVVCGAKELILHGAKYEQSKKELVWDSAFWFWKRKCHDVADKGFWTVLSKLSPGDLTTNKGEKRLEHYKKVAKALNIKPME